jgi:hypothetical protein
MDKSIVPALTSNTTRAAEGMRRDPIPTDQTSWSVYGKLYEDNLNFLRGMLDQAAEPGPQRSAVEQKRPKPFPNYENFPQKSCRGICFFATTFCLSPATANASAAQTVSFLPALLTVSTGQWTAFRVDPLQRGYEMGQVDGQLV